MFLRRSLAHMNYKFSVGTPNTKELATLLPIPTEVITFFFCLLVLKLVPPENEDLF